MDEYSRGMDPELKKHFRKIMSSFSVGLLWLLVTVTAGLFFGLAIVKNGLHWYNIGFYIFFVVTLFALIWFYYKQWK